MFPKFALLPLSTALAQDPLAPPAAPAPSMKTLDQVEPLIPISSLPFEISQPGSYYVTSNLTGIASAAGITIFSSDVTIDLEGGQLACP